MQAFSNHTGVGPKDGSVRHHRCPLSHVWRKSVGPAQDPISVYLPVSTVESPRAQSQCPFPSRLNRPVKLLLFPNWTSRRTAGELCLFRYQSVWFTHVSANQSAMLGSFMPAVTVMSVGLDNFHRPHPGGEGTLTIPSIARSLRQTAVNGIRWPEVHRACGPARKRIAFAQSAGSIGLFVNVRCA